MVHRGAPRTGRGRRHSAALRRPAADHGITLERAVTRGGGALTEPEPVLDMDRRFGALGDYESHAIDSTGMDPAATADCIGRELATVRSQ
jgi:hypothetical protein